LNSPFFAFLAFDCFGPVTVTEARPPALTPTTVIFKPVFLAARVVSASRRTNAGETTGVFGEAAEAAAGVCADTGVDANTPPATTVTAPTATRRTNTADRAITIALSETSDTSIALKKTGPVRESSPQGADTSP